jgi:hypothetical protein
MGINHGASSGKSTVQRSPFSCVRGAGACELRVILQPGFPAVRAVPAGAD